MVGGKLFSDGLLLRMTQVPIILALFFLLLIIGLMATFWFGLR